MPERIAFRSFKHDGEYLSHSVTLISGDASVSVSNDGTILLSSGDNRFSVTKNYVRMDTKNSTISISDSASIITLDGKKGLTGTYTVTKSITVEAGIVVGVE